MANQECHIINLAITKSAISELFAYLGFMFVREEHRGQGINKLIIQGLVDWTRTKGVNEMRLEVYDGNEAAVKAYEKAGFTKNLVEMRIRLDD